MAPFSVIVFGVVVCTIAVSGAKQLRFRFWKRISADGALANHDGDGEKNVTKQKV